MATGPGIDRATRPRSVTLAWTILAAILVWAAFVRGNALRGPFGFGWQHLAATYSTMARNVLEYGPLRTRFAMIQNAAPCPREQWILYTHHPPGMALATAALMTVVGAGPLAIRLLGVLFSLLQIVVTYGLVAQTLSRRAGIAAAFATAVLPAGAYFATHGSELGPEAIALALLALWLDERARARDPARPRSAATVAALAGSLFFAWPALIVAGFIALRDLFERRFRRALLFAAVVPATFTIHWLHMRIAAAGLVDPANRDGISIVDALLSHSTLGVTGILEQLSLGQILHRLGGHLRFLFGDPALIVALLGGGGALIFAGRGAPERRIAKRGFTTAAGLALFAALYTLPLMRAVVVHRYWLIVALPLVAFLCGAAVHATPLHRCFRVMWLAIGLICGVMSTLRVVEAQEFDRTPYFEELGTQLRDLVPPDAKILTTSPDTACIAFYARHEIVGAIGDQNLSRFLGGGNTASPPASGWCAVVEPTVDPVDVGHDQLLAFLKEHWLPRTVRLEQSHADLLLFDFSRKR